MAEFTICKTPEHELNVEYGTNDTEGTGKLTS